MIILTLYLYTIKSEFNQELLDAVNEYRAENGVDPVVVHEDLQRGADVLAEYLCQIGEIGHYGPPGEYHSFADRLDKYDLQLDDAGENVGRAYYVSGIILGWKNSNGGHHEGMLRKTWNITAASTCYDMEDRMVGVLVMAEKGDGKKEGEDADKGKDANGEEEYKGGEEGYKGGEEYGGGGGGGGNAEEQARLKQEEIERRERQEREDREREERAEREKKEREERAERERKERKAAEQVMNERLAETERRMNEHLAELENNARAITENVVNDTDNTTNNTRNPVNNNWGNRGPCKWSAPQIQPIIKRNSWGGRQPRRGFVHWH